MAYIYIYLCILISLFVPRYSGSKLRDAFILTQLNPTQEQIMFFISSLILLKSKYLYYACYIFDITKFFIVDQWTCKNIHNIILTDLIYITKRFNCISPGKCELRNPAKIFSESFIIRFRIFRTLTKSLFCGSVFAGGWVWFGCWAWVGCSAWFGCWAWVGGWDWDFSCKKIHI